MTFGRRMSVLAVSLAATLVASTAPASADLWPWVQGIPPDKTVHTYCYTTSVGSGLKSYIPGAMNYLADNTDVEGTYLESPCDIQNSNGPGGDPATDAAWFQVWVDDAYGQVECKVRTASQPGWCDQWHVRINNETIDASADPHHQYIKTVCHELGHSVGLAHYNPTLNPPDVPGAVGQPHDCQASGSVTSANLPGAAGSWTWQYNQHHKDHINAWF
ncbi:hypothetical protein ACLQ2R_16245 [Streptosporangium sp. DT93]|uniref:hypothetical protein n=1 Tax=Streptosporangium sp. DT93 TaxID=3393428 RepID=UPI003CEB469F